MKKLAMLMFSMIMVLGMSVSVFALPSQGFDDHNGSNEGTDDKVAPKTGESSLPMAVAMAALASAGVAGFSVRKIKEQ